MPYYDKRTPIRPKLWPAGIDGKLKREWTVQPETPVKQWKVTNISDDKQMIQLDVNSHFGQSLHATENISGQRLQVIVSQTPNE